MIHDSRPWMTGNSKTNIGVALPNGVLRSSMEEVFGFTCDASFLIFELKGVLSDLSWRH